MQILVVEDVASVSAMIESALRTAGMTVECASTGAGALNAANAFKPDIVLLDLNLPDVDGMSLVQNFTRRGSGVIVVTASSEEEARVAALNIGADDYMVKPIMVQEMVARIRAVHRRLQGRTVGGERGARISVHAAKRQLRTSDGGKVDLTEAEMLAFDLLIDAVGAPVSRDWISRTALKRVIHDDDRSVDQLVLKLRRKLSTLGCPERTILSVRRQGYVIADPRLFHKADETAGT